MISGRKINHKTLYKLYCNANKKNEYNYKLMLSIGTGVIGASAMQGICGMTDTKESLLVKLGALSVIGLQFLKYSYKAVNKFNSERAMSVLYHWIKTRDLTSQELEERREEFRNIEYWKEIEKIVKHCDSDVEFDNYMFTFILKLKDASMIKEVITNDSYRCYYIDEDNKVDITDISKDFLGRRK